MRKVKQEPGPSLAKFLETGDLGNLSPNFNLDEVYAQLGAAEAIDEHENMTSLDGDMAVQCSLYYPNLTMRFLGQKMFSFQIHFGNAAFGGKSWEAGIADDLPVNLNVNWYKAVKAMRFSGFTQYLKRYRVEAKEVDLDLPSDEKEIWVKPSNLYVLFFGAVNPRIYRIDWSSTPIEKMFGRLSFRLKDF